MKKAKIIIYVSILISVTGICSALIIPIAPPEPMPDSIKAVNSPALLEPFLSSPNNSMEQFWGIERLGQIGSSSDIQRLLSIYENTPADTITGTAKPAQASEMALLAISQIGGPEAESALFSIFDKLNVTNLKMTDSLGLITNICLGMGRIGSPDAIGRLNTVYYDSSLNWIYREDAYIGLLSIELTKPEYKTEADSIQYLLTIVSNHFSKSVKDIENLIITKAVYRIIQMAASTSLLDELKKQSVNYAANSDFRQSLDKQIKSIEYILKYKQTH